MLYSHGRLALSYSTASRYDDTLQGDGSTYDRVARDGYCAYNPRRLLGIGMIPSTGVDDAIAEMSYCAKAHLKGV